MPEMSPRLLALVAAVVGLLAAIVVDRMLPARHRVAFRCLVGPVAFTGALAVLQRLALGGTIVVDLAKGFIAAAAIAAVVYERYRSRSGQALRGRTKRRAALGLAVAAVAAYFAGAAYTYRDLFHVWDQYHYYVGAKYFRELGHGGLYRCAAVAMDEGGFSAEVRAPGRLIRNLGEDNLLIPAARALAAPKECRSRFSAGRWRSFVAEVRFFRESAGAETWERMQRDHGYNAPPVWTLAGGSLASLFSASTRWQQALGALDVILLLSGFLAIRWAFGWRVASLAAVFWGCQAFSSFFWTGGAFLRQDWLFFLILTVCLARRRCYAASGAALACAALLRVFPVLLLIGPVVMVGWTLWRTRRLPPAAIRFAAGGVLAALVLVPASLVVAGTGSYAAFARHLRVHEQTPLSNYSGLRTIIAHAAGGEAGRMEKLWDDRAADPVDPWKEARSQQRERTRPVFWLMIVLAAGWFVMAVRRIRRLWAAQCLSSVWMVLLPELTSYYYSFLLLTAPLRRIRRRLELPLLALAAASQVTWAAFHWNDDRYAMLGLLAVLFCGVVMAAFTPRNRHLPR